METAIESAENIKPIIISMLKRVLKEPKKDNENIYEYEFNCPSNTCKHDKNKFNLNYSVEIKIFRCWKCNYKGFIHKIFDDYGTEQESERIRELVKDTRKKSDINSKHQERKNHVFDENVTCELPEGYRVLTKKWASKYYYKAMEYLNSRKVDSEMIKKHQIGYTESGPRKFRIIIPSFNKNGDVNYYEARSFLSWIKPAYYKPDEPKKTEIIFNYKNLDFNLPVYLGEGPFDMLPLPNSTILLGKELPDILLKKFMKHKTKVILCLDEDALKNSVDIYNMLLEANIDVYFVEIKEDIAKFYERNGKQALIELLRNHRKLDMKYIVSLSMNSSKIGKSKKNYDEKYLKKEWENLKQQFHE